MVPNVSKIILVLILLPSLMIISVQIANADVVPVDPSPPSSCINYDPFAKLITLSCVSASLTDIYTQLNDRSILDKQAIPSTTITNSSLNPNANVWLLKANLTIANGATFFINSTDTKWLKSTH